MISSLACMAGNGGANRRAPLRTGTPQFRAGTGCPGSRRAEKNTEPAERTAQYLLIRSSGFLTLRSPLTVSAFTSCPHYTAFSMVVNPLRIFYVRNSKPVYYFFGKKFGRFEFLLRFVK